VRLRGYFVYKKKKKQNLKKKKKGKKKKKKKKPNYDWIGVMVRPYYQFWS